VQDTVAADAFVEDGEVSCLLAGLEAAGEDVGPAVVGVEGAVGPIGDAVSEGDDGGAVAAGEDVDAFEEGPVDDGCGAVEGCCAGDVAGGGVAGLIGEVVDGDSLDTLRSMGSLRARAPAGMVMAGRPPKVSARSAVGVIALPPALRATWAAATLSDSVPNSLVRTTRTLLPPREMWTISR
jgi:hypothetical protein